MYNDKALVNDLFMHDKKVGNRLKEAIDYYDDIHSSIDLLKSEGLLDNAKKLYDIFSEDGVVSYPVTIDALNNFIRNIIIASNIITASDDSDAHFQIKKFEYRHKELYDSFRYFSHKGNK